jgi:hypothetical protein
VRRREVERCRIAGGEQVVLVLAAAMPHRTDRVDDVLCREAIATGDLRRTRLAAAERAAFLQQFGTGRAMDRAIDAPAAKQRAVRGIYDGVERQRRDVGNEDVEGDGADREVRRGEGMLRSYPSPAKRGRVDARSAAGWGSKLASEDPTPALRADPPLLGEG